jgi:hypothetical protein
MADVFQLDVARLNTYLSQIGPRGEPSPKQALLQHVYEAFLAAGVVKYYDKPTTLTGTIAVDQTGMTLKYGAAKTLYWTEDRIPPIDGVLAGLAYHLLAVLNEPPTPGPWPKQADQPD